VGITITLSDDGGLYRLAADLGAASATVTAKATQVVRKTALDVERDAKALCRVRTGHLKGTIGPPVFNGLSAEISPSASYAAYVEFGTIYMGPQPYMGPALERNAEPFEQAMAQILDGIL
jgi:HK97 gp10 family phage protein